MHFSSVNRLREKPIWPINRQLNRNSEFSFEVCYTCIVNFATISDIIKQDKILKQMKSEKLYARFPSIDIEALCVKNFLDSSFSNLLKKRSSHRRKKKSVLPHHMKFFQHQIYISCRSISSNSKMRHIILQLSTIYTNKTSKTSY